MPRPTLVLGLSCLAALFSIHSARADTVPPGRSAARPALTVLVVVDQMRPDYFTRFHDDLSGGLRELYDHGAVFLHGRQDHALTQTAPGHSTLLSGRTPASTGIVANDLGTPDPTAPVIGAPEMEGASPARFRGTALYDWMLARDSGSLALSVSRKDRGAILPIGRAHAQVFWYADDLAFSTSRYYSDTLPGWLRDWNARRGAARLAGSRWNLMLPAERYPEPDSLAFENEGRDIAFPHVMPTDSAPLAHRLLESPWMDSLTLDLALEGVRRLKLGQRGHTDLLVVSLSTTDEIGHDWGPDSREMHDQIVRVDHWLGWFLDSLRTTVPASAMVVALSADHAAPSDPAYVREVLHQRAEALAIRDLVPPLRQAFDERWHTDFHFAFEYGLLSADVASLAARGIDVDSLRRAVARGLAARPEIDRVYTPETLASAPGSDVYARLWRRQLPPDYQWLVAVVPKPYAIWSRSGSNHGTPFLHDVEVPIIFMGPGIRAGHYERVVPTTSIGPTLAHLLGIRPTEPVDGAPPPEIVGSGR